MDLKQTKAAVEAMLFAHAEPVTAERLAGVLGVEEDAVSRLLLSLRDDAHGRPLQAEGLADLILVAVNVV